MDPRTGGHGPLCKPNVTCGPVVEDHPSAQNGEG